MINNPDPIGFGVYVHWPFCASKCPYCDFNSHVRHEAVDQARFLDAYRREIAETRSHIGMREVSSVFFGGGTPSLMAPETVQGVLDAIASAWHVKTHAEITLEANPSSVEAGRFAAYRAAGVNRVSLGVQSLRDNDLRQLGRLHTAQEARDAIEIAVKTFDRVSFDLIYARPDQTLRNWHVELNEALAIGAAHMSLYQLTIELGTPFADLYDKGRLTIPAGPEAHEFYMATQDTMAAAGLPAYEISNHAAEEEESRHNLLYWRYGEYAGIGPGAHGRLIKDGVRWATSTVRHPETWRQKLEQTGSALTECEALSTDAIADEMLLMGLRLQEGFDLSRLAKFTQRKIDPVVLDALADDGLIVLSDTAERIRPTPFGRTVLNQIVLKLAASMQPATAAEPGGPERTA